MDTWTHTRSPTVVRDTSICVTFFDDLDPLDLSATVGLLAFLAAFVFVFALGIIVDYGLRVNANEKR